MENKRDPEIGTGQGALDDAQVTVWVKAAPVGLPLRKRLCLLTSQHILLYKEVECQLLKGSFKLGSVSNVIHSNPTSVVIHLQNNSSWNIIACEGLEQEFSELVRKMMISVVKQMAVMLEKEQQENSPHVLEWLFTLAQSEPNRDGILLAGVLPALLKLLSGPAGGLAADTVGILARGSEERKMAIQYQGAIAPLVKMLLGDCRVEAAKALTALMYGSEQRKQAIFSESNSPTTVVDMLKSGREDEKEVAVWFLGTIVVGNDKRRDSLLKLGVLNPLLELVMKSGNDTTKEGACAALANFCYSTPAVADEVCRSGCVDELTSALKAENPSLAHNAAMCVTNLAATSPSFRKDLFEAGGVSALIDLLNSSSASTVSLAAASLWNLTLSRGLQHAIATQAVTSALKQANPDDSVHTATGALMALGHYDSELPLSSAAGPTKDDKDVLCILCHSRTLDRVNQRLVPTITKNTQYQCVVHAGAPADTGKKLLAASKAIAKSDVVMAVVGTEFVQSIECYTLFMFGVRLGKVVVTAATDEKLSGWILPFTSVLYCKIGQDNEANVLDVLTEIAANKAESAVHDSTLHVP